MINIRRTEKNTRIVDWKELSLVCTEEAVQPAAAPSISPSWLFVGFVSVNLAPKLNKMRWNIIWLELPFHMVTCPYIPSYTCSYPETFNISQSFKVFSAEHILFSLTSLLCPAEFFCSLKTVCFVVAVT